MDGNHGAMRRWLAIALASILLPLSVSAQLGPGITIGSLTIPNDNLHLGNWTQAGYEFSTPVQGGAPVTTGTLWPVIQATSPNGSCTGIATGNSAGTNLTQLQCEINFASAQFGDGRTGTVVHIPAGDYHIGVPGTQGNGLDIPSNVDIKGDGTTTNLLIQGLEDNCDTGGAINFKPQASGTAFTVTGGATQGSTVLNLSATYTGAIGAWVLVTESSDPAKMTKPGTNNCISLPTSTCFEHHHAKVIATSGTGASTTITLDRPLRDSYTSVNGGTTATIWNPIHNSGLENLELTRETTDNTIMSSACGAADIWYNGVTFNQNLNDAGGGGGTNQTVQFENVARSSVVNSNFLLFNSAARNQAMVFEIGTEDSLFQNNYITNGYESIVVDTFSNGNVTGYNYTASTDTGADGSNFARTYLSHGNWAFENLLEGDTGDGMITANDCFWGTNGPREVYYREEKVNTTTVDQDGVQMGLNTISQGCTSAPNNQLGLYMSVVNSVFNVVAGRPGCTDPTGRSCQPLDQPNGFLLPNTWGEKNRFIGNWNKTTAGNMGATTTWVKSASDSGFCSTNDASCTGFFGPSISDNNNNCSGQTACTVVLGSARTLATGYSGVSEPTQWQTFTFPASFYLTAKPNWWCNESPWPAVGADVTTTSSLNKIPAQRRHDGLACTLAGGSPAITVHPGTLTASATVGSSPPAQTFNVTNSGGGLLTGTVSTSDATHCPISPTTFTNLSAGSTQIITINYSTAALSAGQPALNCSFTASASGLASQVATATVNLLTAPAIAISPTTLSVTAPQGSSPGSSNITVTNTGQATLTNSISCSSANPTFYGNNGGVNPLFTISQPIIGGAATPVILTYATTGLTSAGSPYSDTITCSATGVSNATLGVTITITAVGTAPTYTLGPFGNGRTLVQGQSTSNLVFQAILTSGGSSQASLSVSSNQTWLVPTGDLRGSCSAGVCTTTITTGTLFDRFTATINSAGLAPGTYVATVTAVDNGSCLDTSGAASSCATQTTNIKLVVQAPPTATFSGGFVSSYGPVQQNSSATTLGTTNVCNSGFGSMNVSVTSNDPLTTLSPSTVGPLTNTACTTVTLSSLAGWAFRAPGGPFAITITENDNGSTPVALGNPGQQKVFSGFVTPAPVGLPR